MPLTSEQLATLRATAVGASGNRVQAAIDLLKTTQTATAEEIGFKTSYVADVARGRHATITVANGHKFAEFFGCTIDDLFPAREEAHAE
jgi:transcriptional regulator with XRE-family HTH domain